MPMDAAVPADWTDETEQVVVLPEQPEDELAVKRAERLIRRAGMTAVKETVRVGVPASETATPEGSYPTLAAAIEGAARGNPEARKLIMANVRSDVVERTIKAGHVMKSKLEVDASQRIIQHGQTLEAVHINGLRFASEGWQMRGRAEAEARNSVRLEQAYRKGQLEDYYFVVFSRYADNMTDAEAAAAGFFTATKSCAIQVTTASGAGLTQESAFVAGVKTPGSEQHDATTVEAVANSLGVSFAGKSATEIIDTPLLIRKDLMPRGVIDLVARYDQAAGGTFFGEDKPAQDYGTFPDVCRQREAEWEPIVETITGELIAAHTWLKGDPVSATELLAQLSQREMVNRATQDDSIDARVFGAVAAGHIEAARIYWQNNDMQEYEVRTGMAQNTAESSSCPTGSKAGGNDMKSEKSAGGEEDGECSFISKKCPKCNKKDVKTTVTKTRIYGDCGCSAPKS